MEHPAGPALLVSLLFSAFLRTGAPAAANPAGEAGALSVGTASAEPGRKTRGVLQVGDDVEGTPVGLPVSIVAGRAAGPVVWIQAGTHGDEFGGIRALQELIRDLRPEEMSGTVVAVMAANLPAFRGLQRVNPNLDDLTDLSNTFPGNAGGFMAERIAAVLHSLVSAHAQYFLDLHTGGDRFRQHPFILYTVTGTVPADRMDTLARGFRIPTLWRDAVKIFPTDAITVFAAAGIPSFLVEVGGGQPLDPRDIRMQADAVASFLRAVDVLPKAAGRPPRYRVLDGYRIVTNSRGGFFEPAVRPGDLIQEGRDLGVVRDVHGDVVETLRAPAGSDIVLGVGTYPAWPTGGWLIEIGSGLEDF